MCACSIENSLASDQVLRAVEEALQKFPFSYQGARIISGQEEGAFGWVTVNYLDDRLTQVGTLMSACMSMQKFVHFRCGFCVSVRNVCLSLSSCCTLTSVPFCLCCRACKPQVPLTLEGPPLRLASYLIIMMAQSHRATLFPSDSMEMIIISTLTASCVTGKTKHCEWHWHNRHRYIFRCQVDFFFFINIDLSVSYTSLSHSLSPSQAQKQF